MTSLIKAREMPKKKDRGALVYCFYRCYAFSGLECKEKKRLFFDDQA